MADGYQLAQLNVARLRGPLESPLLSGFVAQLAPINALADESTGFVWRFQTEQGDATSVRPFADDLIIVNLSVWESLEALADFAYRSSHREVLRQRREWFQHMVGAYVVIWWVPAGTRPTVAEARERLDHLHREGPTPFAFTFRVPFPAPDTAESPAEAAALAGRVEPATAGA